MASAEIVKASGQWRNKEPRALKQGLIGDVHDAVIKDCSVGNLDFLIWTQFPRRVLWHFIDEDSSIHHIELMCIFLLYSGWDRQQDPRKEAVFVRRLLQVIFDIRKATNFRLSRLAIQALTQLIQAEPGLLDRLSGEEYGPNHLRENWLDNLVKANVTLLYELADATYIAYLKLVVLLLVQLKVRDWLKTQDYLCINREHVGEFLRELVDVENVYPLYREKYYKQRDVKITTYDMTMKDVEAITDIGEVLEALNLEFPKFSDKKYLVTYLSHYLLPKPTLSLEQKYFDSFVNEPDFAFQAPVLRKQDFTVYQHLVSVLDRVDISLDNSSNLKFNGKSKYFGPADKPGSPNHIYLDISKPNKFASLRRIKKYGIEHIGRGNYRVALAELPEHVQAIDAENVALNIPSLKFNGYIPGFLDYKTSKKATSKSQNVIINHVDQVIDIKGNGTTGYNEGQMKSIYDALMNSFTVIDTPPGSRYLEVLEGILSNLQKNFNERTAVIFPNKNWLNTFKFPKFSNIAGSMEDMPDPLKLIDEILLKAQKLADTLAVPSPKSVREAAYLLKFELTDRWSQYIASLQESKSTPYPFADLKDPEEIAGHYSELLRLSHQLEDLAPILSFENNEAKIKQYMLYNYLPIVYATHNQIDLHSFHNLIFIDSHVITNYKIPKSKRLIVLGEGGGGGGSLFHEAWGMKSVQNKLSDIYTTKQQFEYYGDDVTLHETPQDQVPIQQVSVGKEGSQVSVQQAEASVKLAKQIKATVVCMSPYQTALVKEINAVPVEFIDEITVHDVVVVCLHGYKSINDVVKCIKRCKSVVFLGILHEINLKQGIVWDKKILKV